MKRCNMIFSIVILLLLISFVNSQELITSYSKDIKYGTYNIDKCSGLLCGIGIGKTNLAEYKLITSDNSIIDAYAEGTVKLYEDNYKVFSGIEFYDSKGITDKVKDQHIYIWTKEKVTESYYEYTEQCDNKVLGNGSIERINCISTRGKELFKSYDREYWKEYQGELLKAGTYNWRIEAKRPINKNIDWVLTNGITGTKLDNWLWWDLTWTRKKKINVTYVNPTPTYNYSLYFNISYDSDMQADFDDLRFTQDEVTELPYYLESKVNSGYALVYVKMSTISTNTSIYMYYGNGGASSKSNFSEAFLFGDDFIKNTSDNYDFGPSPGGCSLVKWVNSSQFELTPDGAGSNFCHFTPKANWQRSLNNYTVEMNLSRAGLLYMGLGGVSITYNYENSGIWVGVYPNNVYYKIARGWSGVTTLVDGSVAVGEFVDTYWYILNGTYLSNGTIMANWNGTDIISASNGTTLTGRYGYHVYSSGRLYLEWVRVKAYVPINPVTTFNDEESANTGPTVTLNNPINNYFSSSTNVSFNCSSTDNVAVMNITLSIPYASVNFTKYNTTANQNLSLNYSYIFAQGIYTWSCFAYDNENTEGTTASRTFTVDYTPPVVIFRTPNQSQRFLTKSLPKNITFAGNSTHHDGIGLSVCGYSQTFNVYYIPCDTNYTFNLSKYSHVDNSISFFANDTTGNLATTSVTVYIIQVNDSITGNSSILTESATTLNLYLNASSSNSVSANITYNNTVYPMTLVSTVNNKSNFTVTFNVPLVLADTTFNLWANYSIENATLGTNIYTQQVYKYGSFNVSDVECKDLVYNFTMVDEGNFSIIENGTMEYNFWIGTASNNSKFNYYGIISPNDKIITSLYLCANFTITPTWYIGYGEIVYYKTGYAKETYYILKNQSITNYVNNISLYDLISSDNTEFTITYKDTSFIPRPDTLIFLNRKYVGLGTYKTVEILRTDSLGVAIGNFKAITEKYNLIVTDLYGNILSLFNDISVQCQNVLTDECTITLNANSNSGSIVSNRSIRNMYYDISLDKSTRTITMSYTNSDGSHTILLNTTLAGFINTSVCSDTDTGISGVLTCVIPNSYGNNSFIANIYKDGYRIASYTYSLSKEPTDYYGTDGYFLAFLLILTFPLLLISNPIAMIFGVVLGLVLSMVLLFINGGTWFTAGSVITWVVVTGLILIWQLTKNRGSNL